MIERIQPISEAVIAETFPNETNGGDAIVINGERATVSPDPLVWQQPIINPTNNGIDHENGNRKSIPGTVGSETMIIWRIGVNGEREEVVVRKPDQINGNSSTRIDGKPAIGKPIIRL